MKNLLARPALAVLLAAAALLLGGCWGDDVPPTADAGNRVPDSAATSSSACVSYLQSLPAGDKDVGAADDRRRLRGSRGRDVGAEDDRRQLTA